MSWNHELKTDLEPFTACWAGLKRYEVRKNDRDYRVGDWLVLVEHDRLTGEYTGRSIKAEVVYMTPGGAYGLPPDVCVLGLGTMANRTAVRRVG